MSDRLEELSGLGASQTELDAETQNPTSGTKKNRRWRHVPSFRRNEPPKGHKKTEQQVEEEMRLLCLVRNRFYENIESIEKEINVKIPTATRNIETLTEQVLLLSTTDADKEQELDRQVCELVKRAGESAACCQTRLKHLQQETDAFCKGRTKCDLSPADIRIRQTLHAGLTSKLMETLRLHKAAQLVYKEQTEEKLRRQMRFVLEASNATLGDKKDLEALLESVSSPQDRNQLYQSLVLGKTFQISKKVQLVHDRVAHKYAIIEKIEQQVAVLNQMFLDFSLLALEQGQQLDRIDEQCNRANADLEAGNENLRKANFLQKRLRRKKIRLVIAGVVVVVIVVAVVLIL